MCFRIDNADNRAVSRRVFALEGKARFLAPTPENQFTDTGARGIDWFNNPQTRSFVFSVTLNR